MTNNKTLSEISYKMMSNKTMSNHNNLRHHQAAVVVVAVVHHHHPTRAVHQTLTLIRSQVHRRRESCDYV